MANPRISGKPAKNPTPSTISAKNQPQTPLFEQPRYGKAWAFSMLFDHAVKAY